MTPHIYKFGLLQVLTIFGVYSAWVNDWLQSEILSDVTYLTHAIFLLTFVGIGCAALKRWRGVRFTCKVLVLLGLIGTVIGFRMALSGINPDSVSDVSVLSGLVATLVQGMGVALTTTLMGSIGALWLMIHIFFLRETGNE